MKSTAVFCAAALAALCLAGCAGTPVQKPVAAAADVTCHNVSSNGRSTAYCGTAAQWQEMNRRIALRDAGVTCRFAHTPNEVCMSQEEWKRLKRLGLEPAPTAAYGSYATQVENSARARLPRELVASAGAIGLLS